MVCRFLFPGNTNPHPGRGGGASPATPEAAAKRASPFAGVGNFHREPPSQLIFQRHQGRTCDREEGAGPGELGALSGCIADRVRAGPPTAPPPRMAFSREAAPTHFRYRGGAWGTGSASAQALYGSVCDHVAARSGSKRPQQQVEARGGARRRRGEVYSTRAVFHRVTPASKFKGRALTHKPRRPALPAVGPGIPRGRLTPARPSPRTSTPFAALV